MIKHDGQLDIATGRHRRETAWKNKPMQWSELLKKLSTTHRTAETLAEYMAAKKPRQDEIKDVGGFVGGYLDKGRRRKGSVQYRQLITLDADFPNTELWEDLRMLYDNAACIYSTHKHSPECPRLRLILPLDREVMPDEYIAIARRIAGSVGIEYFDPTTYQPERLMYWPSTAKDGEYLYEVQDGPWLSADAILGSYRDWRDSSEWPMSARENTIIAREVKKQKDPIDKPGVIGAFCRTYTITEAIHAFLTDVYDDCDGVADRFSFKTGSTHGGLIVYDDKFAYSHHGTDPVSGMLCNAFDLVRIHKFGLDDEDARDGTKPAEMPSYKEMVMLAVKDEAVKIQLGSEKLQSAEADFADNIPDGQPVDNKWIGELEVDKKGNYTSTINNIYLLLKHHPEIKGKLMLNEFEGRLLVTGKLPWRKVTPSTKDFTDDDVDCLAAWLEENKVPFTHIERGLAKIRNDNKIHPIRAYLESLKWDGEERLDSLFIDYLGAEDNEYTRAVARKSFTAAVKRIFEPGCKYDTMAGFVGPEGIGKSTLINKMGKEWFSDCLGDIHKKEGMETIRGIWIMEIAELASFKKTDQDAIKRFLSSPIDIYRPSYGKQLIRFPRQCVFFFSTNRLDFLQGGEKHRRYWPILTSVQEPTKNIFTELTDAEVDQLWAEAKYRYHQKEPIFLSDELADMAQTARQQHTEREEKAGQIDDYLETLLPENWGQMKPYQRQNFLHDSDELEPGGTVERNIVCVAEIWVECLRHMIKDMNRVSVKFIHEHMRTLKGWRYVNETRRFVNYGPQKYYEKVVTKSKKLVTKGVLVTKNV